MLENLRRIPLRVYEMHALVKLVLLLYIIEVFGKKLFSNYDGLDSHCPKFPHYGLQLRKTCHVKKPFVSCFEYKNTQILCFPQSLQSNAQTDNT
jgi:hypothetical protein